MMPIRDNGQILCQRPSHLSDGDLIGAICTHFNLTINGSDISNILINASKDFHPEHCIGSIRFSVPPHHNVLPVVCA